MGTIVHSLHSRIDKTDGQSIRLIYRDGLNVFVEKWSLSGSGSLQLVSTVSFRNGHIIMQPYSVGLRAKVASVLMESASVARVPL